MIKLHNKLTGREIAEITEEQLQFLMDNLEEESEEDYDYYINRTTLEMLERNGADASLLASLRAAIGDREDIEIEWFEE
jgi:processive 1,2-diacylglycerol beta-glucosyltransferase